MANSHSSTASASSSASSASSTSTVLAASSALAAPVAPAIPAVAKTWELRQFGQPLTPGERPTPRPGPRDVLVRLKAASLNYRDLRVADGAWAGDLQLPAIIASDAAGEIVGVGSEVTRFTVGDRVTTHYLPHYIDGPGDGPEGKYISLGVPLQGVLTEYFAANEETLVAAPAYLDDREASTLPIAALTAWAALEQGPLRPGQTVLVEGTGGVSIFGLQLAVAAGARVIVTSSSDEKLARAKALGAWAGVNYARHPEWDREVLALTNQQGVDHILEVVGGENAARAINALARRGTLSVIGLIESAALHLDVLSLLHRRLAVRGVLVGSRKQFEHMNRAIEVQQLRPVIDRVYPFSEVPAAFEHLRRGAFGKVVVDLVS